MAVPAPVPPDSAGVAPVSGTPAVGDVFAGRYRVMELLGAGAMGAVFRAADTVLGRTVALKIIHEALARDPVVGERMLVEARSVAAIASEHVARVLDMGRGPNGAPFLVLEHLEGVDFFTLLERRGPLPVEDAVDWILEACEALAEAHAAHVVHRDLKPENLFLSRRTDGTHCVKVLDFGISKRVGPRAVSRSLTQPSEIVGSPHYMAPEQLRLAPVDPRTDVWALGATLYELLSGRRAFDGESFTEVCARVLSEEPRPLTELRPGLPNALAAVVETALSKDPDARYSSVARLAAALAPFGSERAERSAERIFAVLGEEAAPEVGRAVSGARRIALREEAARVRQARTTPSMRGGRRGRLAAIAGVGATAALVGAVLAVSIARTTSGAEARVPTVSAAISSPAPAAELHDARTGAAAAVVAPARAVLQPAKGAGHAPKAIEPPPAPRTTERPRRASTTKTATPPPPRGSDTLPGLADFGGRK